MQIRSREKLGISAPKTTRQRGLCRNRCSHAAGQAGGMLAYLDRKDLESRLVTRSSTAPIAPPSWLELHHPLAEPSGGAGVSAYQITVHLIASESDLGAYITHSPGEQGISEDLEDDTVATRHKRKTVANIVTDSLSYKCAKRTGLSPH